VSLLELLLIFLKATMLSSGGLQALPILQEDLVNQRAVLTVSDFAASVAIGRVAPGPNGLFVITIGYYILGVWGAIVGIFGLSLPPFLAVGLIYAYRKIANRPWVAGLTRGIGASSVGLLAALGFSFTTPLLPAPASILILLGSLAILLIMKIDALPILGAGAIVGVLLFFLGIPLA
jgi:chromate transporter